MVNENKNNHKIIYFLIFIFFYISLTLIFIRIDIDPEAIEFEKKELISLEKQKMDMINQYIDRRFEEFQSDLFFLKDVFLLNSVEETTSIWATYLEQKPTYVQLRYLDKNGDEIIRINHDPNSTITVVPEEELQNKAKRYYFQESKSVPEGGIYYSAFDLNIENNVIEEPKVRTIRIATPIYENDKFNGIVILNLDLNTLLEVIEYQFYENTCKNIIINRNGYYILNKSEPEKEFAFMFPNLMNIKFLNDYADAWKDIYENKDAEMHTFVGEAGVFNYRYIFNPDQPNIRLHDSNYILISIFPRTSDEGKIFYYTTWDLIKNTIVEKFHFGVLIFLFSALVAYLLGQREIHKQKITRQARIDSFTNTYNRPYGLYLFQKQNQEYQKKNLNASICFVDIDSLKFINDTYGHEKGDLLITKSVNVIKKHLSENDFIIRLGGDEFLIIFENLTTVQAEEKWKKILVELNQIDLEDGINFIVWLSHGISEYGVGYEEIMESIAIADKNMYEEKFYRKMNKNK